MKDVSTIAATVVVVGLVCLVNIDAEETNVTAMVSKMVAMSNTTEALTYYNASGLITNKTVITELARMYQNAGDDDKKTLIMQMIGEHVLTRSAPYESHFRPVDNPEVIDFLLKVLDDPNPEIRRWALRSSCGSLSTADTRCLKGHEKKIVETIKKDRLDDRETAYFLGRLGTEGIDYLRNDTNHVFPELYRVVALAKAGDTNCEARVIRRFEQLPDKDKGQLMNPLVYIGTEEAAKTLAKQLRSPTILSEPRERLDGYWTFRYQVILCLSKIYREEKVFKYDPKTFSEEDCIRIEKWAEDRFGIVWTNDRPKFIPIAPGAVILPPRDRE